MKYFTVLTCIFTSICSYSQQDNYAANQYKTSFLDLSNGLISNSINYCIKDHKEFLWVATDDGVTRCSGKNSIHFNSTTHPFLKDQKINKLVVIDSVLFAASTNELYAINANTLQLTKVVLNAKYGELKDIAVSKSNELLVATESCHLIKYNHRLKKMKLIFFKVSQLQSICVDDNGFVLIAAVPISTKLIPRGEILKYNIASNKIIKSYSKIGFLYYTKLRNIGVKGIFINAENGLLKYNQHKDDFQLVDTTIGIVRDVVGLNDGIAYFNSATTMFSYNESTREKKEIPYSKFGEIKALYVDVYGDFYVSTRQGVMVAKKNQRFEVFKESPTTNTKNKVRRSIIEDTVNNRIFFFTYGGVDIYNTRLNKYEKSIHTFQNAYDAFQDNDSIWISTEGYGVYQLNTKTLSVKKLFTNNKIDGYRNFAAIKKDDTRSSTLLLGSYEGLFQQSTLTGDIKLIPLQYNGVDYSKVLISAIIRRNKLEWWLCTEKGLLVLNNNYQVIKRYGVDEEGAFNLPTNNVNTVLCNENGYYVGLDNDLFFLPINGAPGQSIFFSQFGSCDKVIAINKDKNNRIWFATYNGIYAYDIQLNKLRVFHAPQYINTNEFNRKANLLTKDGLLYYGSIAEYIQFNPLTYTFTNKAYPFSFNSIKLIDGKKNIISYDLLMGQEVILPNYNSSAVITFKYQDYLNVDLVKYYYKVEGLYNEWINLDDKTSLELISLPSGKWKVDLKAVDQENMITTTLYLFLTVPTVFYKTIWFYLLILLGISILFYIFYKLRINNLEQQIAYRIDLANDLHDSVGTAVTKTIFAAESLLKEIEVKDKRLIQIAEYGRQVSSSFRDALWSADARTDKIENLVDRIAEIGLTATDDTKFYFVMEKFKLPPDLHINLKIKRTILMIVREAINNVLKHSTGDTIKIILLYEHKKMKIEIIDNGQGAFSKINNTHGMGILSMKTRTKRIQADIKFFEDEFGFHILLTI